MPGTALAVRDDAPSGHELEGASLDARLSNIEATISRIESKLDALGRDAHALAEAASTVTSKLSGGGGIMSLLMGKG